MVSRNFPVSFALFLAAVLVFATPTETVASTTLVVNGTATATSTVGTSIVTGDVFNWSVTFDLNSLSTGDTGSFGKLFNNSITSFTLTRSAGNAGTWNPTGVVWPITPAANVPANVNDDSITVQLRPTSAPALNSVPFWDLGLNINWSPSDLDAVWTAGAISLATLLGTSNPPLTAASYLFELRDTNFASATFTAAVVSPPAPLVIATPLGVTFETQGGSPVAKVTTINGGSVTDPGTPTRSGFTFAGWNTAADGSGTPITFPYHHTNSTDFTLYAQWRATSNTATTPTTSPPTTVVTPQVPEELPSTGNTMAAWPLLLIVVGLSVIAIRQRTYNRTG